MTQRQARVDVGLWVGQVPDSHDPIMVAFLALFQVVKLVESAAKDFVWIVHLHAWRELKQCLLGILLVSFLQICFLSALTVEVRALLED